ncbi:MAG: right-handed parallel beta-helix repeat-containing protein [Verrucomicrobia bacterium]|nr:right-handed parallel beta-helix repeat-containing protein [Verrucomicrobiota bacterium]
MNTPTTKPISLLLALVLSALGAQPGAAETPSSDWQLVFEDNMQAIEFDDRGVSENWYAQAGQWLATPEGVRKSTTDSEGVLLCRTPVGHGDVRIDYEAMSRTPGDLSLLLGCPANERLNLRLDGGPIFFGFGSKGNTASRILIAGGDMQAVDAPRITPGKWHRITVTRANGQLLLSIDGEVAIDLADPGHDLVSDYFALYGWHSGTFRSVRVWTRPASSGLSTSQQENPRERFRSRLPLDLSQTAQQEYPAPGHPLAVYVSPHGRDSWSGALPDPTADGSDGPLATIQAAFDWVAQCRSGGISNSAFQICLRGGRHELEEPIIIRPEQGGRASNRNPRDTRRTTSRPVTVCAYPGEEPILSGGRQITGWHPTTVNGVDAWTAPLPDDLQLADWPFRQLWVNGRRAARTRLPQTGFYRVAPPANGWAIEYTDWREQSSNRFHYAAGDLNRNWKNLTDVEVHLFNYWIDPCMRIEAIDTQTNVVTLDRNSLCNLQDDDKDAGGAQYIVENVFEALTEPGQWYLDRPDRTLYYIPRPGESMATVDAIIPIIEQLVRVEGAPDDPVQAVRFRGIAFAHTEYRLPPTVSSYNQAANGVSGAIAFTSAVDCALIDCSIAHVGGYGVEVLEGSLDVAVTGCDVTDLGAGGIKVWHGSERTLVRDNHITHGGHLFHAGVGALIGRTKGTQLLHNEIAFFDYSGVSVGWSWGYRPNDTYGNIVSYNHIHHIGNGKLSDTAGVYTLGVQPGTRITDNLIHDVVSRTYGGWGLYTDEGSSDMLWENNLAYNCKTGGFHQHYGRDNIIRNNILAFSSDYELKRSRLEPHDSFAFTHNIVVAHQPTIWCGDWTETHASLDHNIYWTYGDTTPRFGGSEADTPDETVDTSFAAWQSAGRDRHSLLADPQFVDPQGHDFSLKPSSPALALGFKPFDLSTVGPRQNNP